MNLTKLVRTLESQLKSAEKYARRYDLEATALKSKLASVAGILGTAYKSIRDTTISSETSSSTPRKLSAAGRARIIAGQRKRWAGKGKTRTTSKAKRRKTKLSPAGRAKIVAAQRKRWSDHRKAQKVKAS